MTGQDFRSRYFLGERLTQPPVVTHRATDDSGNLVLAHFLLGSPEVKQADLLRDFQKIRDESPEVQDRIREVTETDGVTVVVTSVLEDFTTFSDWLEAKAGPVSEEVSPQVAAGEEGPSVPAEEEEPPVVAEGEPPAVADAESPAKSSPGAYTQLFKASDLGFGKEEHLEEEQEEEQQQEEPEAVTPAAPPPPPETGSSSIVEPPPEVGTTPAEEAPPEEEALPEKETPAKKAPGSYTMLFGPGEVLKGEPVKEEPEPLPSTPEAQEPPPPPQEPPTELPAEGGSGPRFPKVEAGAPVFPEPDREGDAGGEEPQDETRAPGEASRQSSPPVEPEPQWEGAAPSQEPTPPSDPAPPPDPAPPVPPASGTGSGDKKSPGAYTRIFRGLGSQERSEPPKPPAPEPPRPGPPTPQAPPPPPPQASEKSPPEWQRWKDSPGASGDHIPSDDYLQRLGGSGGGVGPPPTSSTQKQTPAGPPSDPVFPGGGAPSGPGHYTMIREGLSPSSPVSSGRRPVQPPGEEGKGGEASGEPASMPSRRSRTLTILGLVAIVVIIVALILVFTLTG